MLAFYLACQILGPAEVAARMAGLVACPTEPAHQARNRGIGHRCGQLGLTSVDADGSLLNIRHPFCLSGWYQRIVPSATLDARSWKVIWGCLYLRQ